MLVQNNEGDVSFDDATKLENLETSLTMAEALGIRWCLQLENDQVFDNLIVETDTDTIAKCLQGIIKLDLIDPIILDCKEMLSHMQNT